MLEETDAKSRTALPDQSKRESAVYGKRYPAAEEATKTAKTRVNDNAFGAQNKASEPTITRHHELEPIPKSITSKTTQGSQTGNPPAATTHLSATSDITAATMKASDKTAPSPFQDSRPEEKVSKSAPALNPLHTKQTSPGDTAETHTIKAEQKETDTSTIIKSDKDPNALAWSIIDDDKTSLKKKKTAPIPTAPVHKNNKIENPVPDGAEHIVAQVLDYQPPKELPEAEKPAAPARRTWASAMLAFIAKWLWWRRRSR
jgi:hypothetical protein